MKKLTQILYNRPFLIFLLFLFVAYLPVFLPFFHLKNDLITQNLPTRYIISESLDSGYFPWWNPYIHFGIPQYGDMNNGFWNPFLWLIAKTVGYNIWTITLEEMFYLLIGGWGMYKLIKELRIEKGIAIVIALSYMSCGYVTGHLQHFCWITGVAFFPYVVLYFLKINQQPVLKNFIAGAMAVFFFVSSTHPGLIIGAIYFFIFALLFIFIFRRNYCSHLYGKHFGLVNLLFLILSGIFSIVVIISNAEVLQHISRGDRVNESIYPTSLQSFLSLAFPLAVNKSAFFATDISMRNMYIGLAGLAGFVLLLKKINIRLLIGVLVALIFFILISLGIFHNYFPLLAYVRLSGEFSYFTILILLIGGAFGLQAGGRYFSKKFLIILLVLILILGIISLIDSHHLSLRYFFGSLDFKSAFKLFITQQNGNDLLTISCIIQALTLCWIIFKRRSKTALFYAVSVNLIIITWLTLPFTGLGMKSKKEMHESMTMLPKGIHPQEFQSLNNTAFLNSSLKGELILLGSYSKKIGYPEEEMYPVQLKSTAQFFADTALHRFINQQSFIFLHSDTTINAKTSFDSSNFQIQEFGPGHLKLTVKNTDYHFITFLQNNYRYWEVFINGKKTDQFTGYKTFITLPIANGKQEIEYRFNPSRIRKSAWVNLGILLMGIFVLAIPALRNTKLFS